MRIFKSKCGLPTVTEQVELSEINSAHEAQVLQTCPLPNYGHWLYSSMIEVQGVAIPALFLQAVLHIFPGRHNAVPRSVQLFFPRRNSVCDIPLELSV
jgi:hypothetical protein